MLKINSLNIKKAVRHFAGLRHKKIFFILALALVIASVCIGQSFAYVPSAHDTRMEQSPMEFTITDLSAYQTLYEGDTLEYLYKADTGVVAIKDKRNGYTWKTGLDLRFNTDIDEENEAALDNGETPPYAPKEVRMNTVYIGIANSLFSVDYFDESLGIKTVSSNAQKGVTSEFVKLEEGHYAVNSRFSIIDIKVTLHIYFDDAGITYKIFDNEVEGKDQGKLAAIMLNPFLGAAGGVKSFYNPETEEYSTEVPNEMIPGYIFVPDGSGALIRFTDYNTKLSEYLGNVYGDDKGQSGYYYNLEAFYTPFKEPTMPVYGIAHGNNQNAFVGYASEGAEHLEIIAMPEDNMTYYNWAYPRFVYNKQYRQLYNKRGDGYFTLLKERNHFDISMRYEFLEGGGEDNEPSADYVGMAKVYGEYIASQGLRAQDTAGDIPIRLDFIMADTEKNILGYKEQVVTTVSAVKEILADLTDNGVKNINSALYGWQKGGTTLGKPWQSKYSSDIGSKKEFQELLEYGNTIGALITFGQDYALINKEQTSLTGTASKHVNGWYNELWLRNQMLPISTYYYATPQKSYEWFLKQTHELDELGIQGVTIDGISNLLYSSYTGKEPLSITDSMNLIKGLFYDASSSKNYNISADNPNAYLWPYVDKFINMPVFTTQFLIETDTVPFLQIVLDGAEVYAPYSNFSFYNDKSILRMIDYNVYPSFILTKESSHYLANTNSADFYSTEYAQYKDTIIKIYSTVNDALKNTLGAKWISRNVVQDGIIVNTYDNGVKVVVNYTDEEQTYEGIKIKPVYFAVIK